VRSDQDCTKDIKDNRGKMEALEKKVPGKAGKYSPCFPLMPDIKQADIDSKLAKALVMFFEGPNTRGLLSKSWSISNGICLRP